MPTLKLNKGEGVKLFGPMAFTVLRGTVEILGKKVVVGERVIIHRLKSYAVVALEDSELDLSMVNEAQIKRLEDNEAYFEWVKLSEEIVSSNPTVVVVVGEVDSGKSSFTTLLLNKALERGMRPALVDADVGQADVAPPGYVSLAYPSEQTLWNRGLKPVRMCFVGDNKPQRSTDAIINYVKRLVEQAVSEGRTPVVVDTDGWMKEVGAVLYKTKLVVEVRPDYLVHVGGSDPSFSALERLGVKYRTVPSPSVKKVRDRSERREYRSDRYREFFANAVMVKYDLNQLVFVDMPLLQGARVDLHDERVVYSSVLAGKYFVVARGDIRRVYEELSASLGRDKLAVYPQGFERGLYVSLSDGKGNECPGIVEKIDFDAGKLLARTPCPELPVRVVRASTIRLTEDFKEEYIEY
ncbi:Clp1/GlmU family protein [Thermogladius sp.]|uniref:Clp1/GlmU family protein n=1 Tax=Thermogladius sp. TaxID=2023064 RepID=UPI003D11DD39